MSIQFKNDPVSYLSPSWEDMDNIVFNLSKKIMTDGLKFEKVITLSKGGWPMARPLIDYLGVKRTASVGLKLYRGINERANKPVVYQDLTASVENEDILLFDDVADTGESLEFVVNYLKERGAKTITTVCLFYKPSSSIKPSYYGEETTDWIIFPYELKETMDVLVSKWKEQSVAEEEIVDRFVKLGFDKEKVEYFLKTL